MQLALASHAARVFRGQLRQHELFTLQSDHTIVLLSAFGMPRLWGYALDAAEGGFREGFDRPHDGRVSTRLHQGIDGAQRALRVRVDSLIERRTPDVALLALALEGDRVQVSCVGPARVYLCRAGDVRRLTPVDARAEGLLKARPAFCSEITYKGDLILGGSHTAFADDTREGLRDELAQQPLPEALVDLLNAKAVKNGLGVGSFALKL